ncbi:hypothetical protein HDU76_011323, partial [Blyttiomyces sp. JEL0837]
EFGLALDLCAQYNLDTDEVFKMRWRKSNGDEFAIRDFLNVIKDRRWVVLEALERVLESATLQRGLLKFVVKVTDGVTLKQVEEEVEEMLEGLGSGDGGGGDDAKDKLQPSVTDLCFARLTAFKYLDRLETFEAIQGVSKLKTGGNLMHEVLKGSFEDQFEEFRGRDLGFLACRFAAVGHVGALEIFFKRHWKELKGVRLCVLDCLPLTLDPLVYVSVLPRVKGDGVEEEREAIPWRRPDWTEVNSSVKDLVEVMEFEDGSEGGKVSVLEKKLMDWVKERVVEFPASVETLAEWVSDRVLMIENKTGQTNVAKEVCRIAVEELGVVGLEGLLENLKVLSDLVYGCGKETLTYDEVLRMSVSDVLELMVADVVADPVEFTRRVEMYVKPMLDGWARERVGDG